MKKNSLLLALLVLVCQLSYSKPAFSVGKKYHISCLYDMAQGMVVPATGEYKLTYSNEVEASVKGDSSYWYIQEVSADRYTFQNVATHKYLRHNNILTLQNKDRWALDFVDALQPDLSTSFTLELHKQGNLCYYAIRSVVNTEKVWERRTASQVDALTKATVFPVGVITGGAATIQNFIFYDNEGAPVTDFTPVVMPNAKPSLGVFSVYLDSLTFDNKTPVIDLSNGEFFLSVPRKNMGSDVKMKISYKSKKTGYRIYIDGTLVDSGSDFTFRGVTGTSSYDMEVRENGAIINAGTILFSCLPLVQIYTDDALTPVYDLGRIVVTEPESFTPSEVLLANLRTRGYFAGRQEKKSLAIKLKDTNGVTPVDRTFFGLRNDNNWILDAMYNDHTRSRNRVSTDFWLDFSTRPYYAAQEPEMVNGTRGSFVEVFLNDSYNGLYCMTEKIDRKQLNVKKFKEATDTTPIIQRGSVVKADDWSDATWFGLMNTRSLNKPTANYASWYRFDVKYPDAEEGEPFDWTNLYDAVNVVTYSSSEDVFETQLEKYVDMPVFLDYYLFMDLLLLTDNHGKNFFVSTYDQTVSPKLSLTPWDLDSSWGMFWDGSAGDRMRPDQSFEYFIRNNVPRQSTLYHRLLDTNTLGFNDQLIKRYRELRGTYFNAEKIMSRFRKNNELFQVSGALDRETSRWSFSDTDDQLDYISDWINQRLYFLDFQYLDEEYVNGVDKTLAPSFTLSPNPVQNVLTISHLRSGDVVRIYSAQGLAVAQVKAKAEQESVDMSGFSTGIYLVKVGSSVVKLVKK